MAKAGLLFVGSDDGIVLFSNPGAIGRWLRVGHELRGRAVHAIWPVADNPLVVLAAAGDAGLQRSDDGGQSWRQVFEAAVTSLAGRAADPQTIFLGAADGRVYRSSDAGASWDLVEQAARAAEGPARLVVGSEPGRLYLADDGGVWASADDGTSWSRYGTGARRGVSSLAAAPAHSGALYAVAESALYRCAGESAPWERLAGAQPDPSAALGILAGKDPALLLAQGGGVARSADDGSSWALADAEDPWSGGVTVIAPAPYHLDTAFAGSGSGQLATSADRGRSWQALKRDLPPIRSIAAARLA